MKYVFSIVEQNGAIVRINAVITYPTNETQVFILEAKIEKNIGMIQLNLSYIETIIRNNSVRQEFVSKLKQFLRPLLTEVQD